MEARALHAPRRAKRAGPELRGVPQRAGGVQVRGDGHKRRSRPEEGASDMRAEWRMRVDMRERHMRIALARRSHRMDSGMFP